MGLCFKDILEYVSVKVKWQPLVEDLRGPYSREQGIWHTYLFMWS